MEIREIINLPENQRLLEAFCDAVGVAAAVIDTEGEILVKARWKRVCTDFHRAHDGSCARCIESDTELAAGLLAQEEYTLYKCRNGLNDAASPILIDGEHVANAFAGQFLTEEPDMEFFRAQAKEFGFDEEEYLAAVREVPVVDEDKLPAMARFLVTFAQIVTKTAMDHRSRLEAEQRLAQSAHEILEISAPVIPVWEGVVAAPLIGTLDSQRTQVFMERLLEGIVEHQAQFALVDITGVPTVDTQTAQHLIEAIASARLLGTRVILTGVRPAIAQTLVHLGIELGDVPTRSTLSAGIALALEGMGLEVAGQPH